MYLLDTDSCIQLCRGNPTLLKALREHRRSDIQISILSVYELELGLQKATLQKQMKRKALDDLLELFVIAPFEKREAVEAARIRAELEKAGTPIGSIDCLISATARANHWTVVTGNVAEFRRVKHLKVATRHRECCSKN